jgi:hypothetical protein
VLAARTLHERGGRLVLLNPQQPVTRLLTLLGRGPDAHRPRGNPGRATARRQPGMTIRDQLGCTLHSR